MKFHSEQVLFMWGTCSALAAIVHASEDYYKILSVSRDATYSQIKKAFRKLAAKYHPDKNKREDAEAEFVKIAKAYEVLSDPQKKQNYDQYGDSSSEGFKINIHDFFKVFDDHFRQHNTFTQPFQGRHNRQQADSFRFENGRTVHLHDLFGFEDEDIPKDSRSGDQGAEAAAEANAKFKQGGFHNSQSCRTVLRKVGNTLTTGTVCL